MIGPIGICVHSYKGVDFNSYFNHIYCVARWAQKYDLIFVGKGGLDAASARNGIVERAISHKCTHAFFLDEDHLVPVQTLDYLWETADEAIVSGVVCKKGEEYQQICWEVRDDKDGLQYFAVTLPLDGRVYQVNACAFGCTLINLEKLQKLKKPWFRDTCDEGYDGVIRNSRSDINLCLAFRAIGEKAFVDTRVLVGHVASDGRVIYPQAAPRMRELISLEHELTKLREGQVGNYYTIGDQS